MKRVVLVFTCLSLAMSMSAHADETSQFGEIHQLSPKSFASQLHVKGEVFVLDPSGSHLVTQFSEERTWYFGRSKSIGSNWVVEAKGIKPVVLSHHWEVQKDNSLVATIKQFESTDRKKLVRQKTIQIKNFSPITWVADSGGQYRVVARFTPVLDSSREIESLKRIPIGGDEDSFEVSDNQGYLWGDNVRLGGILSGMESHRGSFIISFYPFKGAKAIGSGSGKVLVLHMNDKLTVKITNDTQIVPGDMRVRVYGIYIPTLKSSSPKSVWSFGQDKVEGIPKPFREAAKIK